MIYICNFYAHNKEAISNQIEFLRSKTSGILFAAGIFLGQKSLDYFDLSQNRIILPERIYSKMLPHFLHSIPEAESIHYFSEKIETNKLKLFNSIKNSLYISMYRRPTKKYAEFLKKLSNLKNVFVELNLHKEILIKHNFPSEKIIVTPTPSLFKVKENTQLYSGKFLFASWNGGKLSNLKSRGLIAILDLLEAYPLTTCRIIIRDFETKEYKNIIKTRNLKKRVKLISIKSFDELQSEFDNSDIILFLMQKKITKDVPNSVIDALSLGKPILITNVVDIHHDIKSNNAGWVISTGQIPNNIDFQKDYDKKAKNAFILGINNTKENYINIILSTYK